MVRFVNGQPDSLYLSAHSGGSAYKFDAVPKLNGRPITYIATGTHANYIKAGTIQHDVPLLVDHTDAGHLWDVTKNFRGFTYDNSTGVFASAGGVSTGGSEQGGEGVGWLNFGGHWGDQEYTIIIKDGQYCVTPTECKFVDGPTGKPLPSNVLHSVHTKSPQVLKRRTWVEPQSAKRRPTVL